LRWAIALSKTLSRHLSVPRALRILSERNSLGSVDWPPIGSSHLLKQPEKSGERCPSQTSIDRSSHSPRKTEGNENDSILLCRKAPLSQINSRNWMNLKFWRDIHHLTVTVSLFAQKSPRQSLISPFQDPWCPTSIASFVVCPNETTPSMHHQFGLHPPHIHRGRRRPVFPDHVMCLKPPFPTILPLTFSLPYDVGTSISIV
jgi:hypothetical protein